MDTDYVQRFLFENLDVRGRLVCLTNAWRRMTEGRGYPAPISSTIADGVSCSSSSLRNRAGCSDGDAISSQRRSSRSPSK